MSFSSTVRRFWPLCLTFLLPLAAFGLRLNLESLIGKTAPFLLFFAPVTVAAWQGGQRYGLLATLWSSLLASLLFVAPEPNFSFGWEIGLPLLIFIVEGVFISTLIARYRTAQLQLTRRTLRQTALAQISGLALAPDDDLDAFFVRAGEICAQNLSAHSLVLSAVAVSDWKEVIAGQNEVFGVADVFNSLLSRAARSEIGEACSLMGAPFTYGGKTGILLVLSDQKRAWNERETEFLGAVADILSVAARHKRESALRRSGEARYRAFVEQSAEAIWCIEFEPPLDLSRSEDELIGEAYECGILVECNDVFARMYGFEGAAQMLGARLDEILVRDEPRNLEYFRAFLRSNYRLTDAESVETDREGQPREFVNNLVGIVENGRLQRAWGTQRDVSQQKDASARLRASEERFRALFDTAPIAIAITRDGLLLYVNRASVELLGCKSPDEMIGHAVSEFVAPPDRETMQKRIERRATGFDEPLIYETNSLRRDGERRPFRIEIAQLELPDGAATLAFAFDLTQEKADQAQRAALLERERRTTQRAVALQEITAALAGALTFDEVAQIITSQGVAALQANSGALSIPDSDEKGAHLRIIAAEGYPDEILEQYRRLPLDDLLPAVRAFLENRPIWLGSIEEAVAHHPIFGEVFPRTGTKAVCALPLEVKGRVLGMLSLSFQEPQNFDAEMRAFMLTLTGQCAQALDRVRLFNEARDAARMQQESLALLDILLDSAPVGFAFLDLEARHVLVNRALSQISGISVQDQLGRTLEEISPQAGAALGGAIRRVLSSGKPSGEIELIVPSDEDPRSTRHCLCSFYPVFTGKNELLGVGAVILDVTARMQDERERVQLLGELEIERARFEAILQQMPSAVIMGEAPSGSLILGNPQVGEVFRYPFVAAPTVEGYDAYIGFHPDGRELLPAEWPLARAIQKGETVRGEEIIIARGDDSMGVIRVNAAPIRDREGQIMAGVAVFDDVTQRARTDNAQRFLAEAGSALVSSLDEREISAQLARFCVPRIADWCIVAIPGSDGRLTEVSIAGADVNSQTNSKTSSKAEKDAQHAEFERRLQFQFSTDPRYPWDVASVMQGQKAALYLDHSPETLRQQGASEEYRQLMADIGVRCAVVAPLCARGRILGVMIWMTAQSSRCYDATDLELADELARRAALTADNARLYHESQNARDEAQNANRAKDEFLAVVSHELRTPLTPILGWLELLRSPGADENLRAQAYAVIERNARAQAQLVNDILDVSRITTGKLRLEFKSVALAALVKNAVESLRPIADEKGVRVETALAEVGPVRADANRIQQVVWNLLQNAIKFTPAGGLVRVNLETREGRAVLQVSDSGAGIEPAFLPHVFDRFRQADSSSTRKTGGLGLGLAIVSHIVEGHNGSVEVRSEGLGSGATFCVEIPLLTIQSEAQNPENAPKTPVARRRAPGVLEGLQILVTDDDADTREMMKRLLQTHGARAQTASSAHETLEIFAQNPPDLLLCDIGMPETDGYELRRELTQRGFNKPSVALTAYTAPSDAKRALDTGFDAHLPKPVDANALLTLILRLAKN